ncbi:MAG TPA: murein biosynthesis integral membrane protein MurJ [Candidatus Limnocylindrales bacterium]|nr:murein biosynthesis integral membrane protein MurJ [Candidatus Limnocylindrales bacterium]
MTDDLDALSEATLPEARPMAATIARAGLVVSAAYLASRVLGYFRYVIIATTFGAGSDLDSFLAAFRIPDFIFQLVAAGAVASALVPIVSGFIATGQQARAWRIVATVANLMLLGLVVLAGVAFVFAPLLVPAIAPGFDASEAARTVDLTRIMLVGPILLALGAVATAALNGSRRFAAAAAAPSVYNLAIIGAAILLAPSLGVVGLALGVVAGSAGHLFIQLPALARVGFRYRPRIDLGDGEARHALLLMAPRALGLGATQLIFVVLTSLASTQGLGAITAYTIAFSLLQIPIGVIGVPLGIVLFPSLAGGIASGQRKTYVALVERGIRIASFVMLPIAAVGMVLASQVVALLLGYGRFDATAAALTASTLVAFLVGLPAYAPIEVLARAFYARQDTVTPVFGAVLCMIATVITANLLVGAIGLPALGVGLSLGNWLEMAVLLLALRRREGTLDLGSIARLAAVAAAGSVLAAAVALGAVHVVGPLLEAGKLRSLLEAVAATVGATLTFIVWARLTRLPELTTLVDLARGLIGRRTGPRVSTPE